MYCMQCEVLALAFLYSCCILDEKNITISFIRHGLNKKYRMYVLLFRFTTYVN